MQREGIKEQRQLSQLQARHGRHDFGWHEGHHKNQMDDQSAIKLNTPGRFHSVRARANMQSLPSTETHFENTSGYWRPNGEKDMRQSFCPCGPNFLTNLL